MADEAPALKPGEAAAMPPPRVAVVAVHGVADQHPGDTAKDLAQQLSALSQFDPQAARYSPWEHETLRIDVSPVTPARFDVQQPTAGEGRYPAFLHSEFALEYFGERSTGEPALEFMSRKLAGYRGDAQNQSYALTRLSGHRTQAAAGAGSTGVDVYEMYWADLSRLGTGVLRILGEFYQLLFHLTVLGRLTVDLARSAVNAPPKSFEYGKWVAVSEFQAAASWVLSVPIALLNLILIFMASVALPMAVPHEWRPLVAAFVYGGVAGIAVAAYRLRRNLPAATIWGAAIAIGAGLIVYLLLCSVSRNAPSLPFGATQALAIGWMIAIAAATVWLARALGRHIRRAFLAGCIIAAIVTVAFAWQVYGSNTREHVVLAGMFVVDGLFALLYGSWFALVIAHLGAWVCGAVAGWGADAPARRAIRTGRIGMAVPTGLFLVVTLAVWAALKGTILNTLPDVDYLPLSDRISPIPLAPPEYFDRLLEMSAGRGFNILLALMLAGAACMLWAVLPALVAELRPPQAGRERRSRGMGDWLDEGIGWGVAGTALLVFAIVFWLPFAPYVLDAVPALKAFSGHTSLIVMASVLTGSAVGVIAFPRYTDVLLKGIRAVLDIALDVDQWLREQPYDRTPAARICARYASLLRYIVEWRGPDGRGYDGIVIVSHSQGTVITTELLRFIRAGYVDPRDSVNRLGRQIPVRLLTVGSPLRQLYSRRFPHLYDWAASPDIGETGAERWINAYFSGDYVGRYLWRRDNGPWNWNPVQESWTPGAPNPDVDVHADGRTEFCLGAGAHTHYFDGTSRLVARAADALVAA